MNGRAVVGRIGAFLMNHKRGAVDGTVLVMVVLLALFYVYEIDVFVDARSAPVERTIELDEALLVAALFCGGTTLFAIRRWQEARRETSRRLKAEREARTLAFHDALTGLPNRRQFDEALRAATSAPPRTGACHAVMLIDLNGFKRINDVFGHAEGDEVLMQVAAGLSRSLRAGDMVARLGGDEFAILATHLAGPEAAIGVAVRAAESTSTAIVAQRGTHDVGMAIGISLTPQDGADGRELIRKADVALYRAKEEKSLRPSSFRFFETAMDASVRERDLLERDLRQAIKDRSIRLVYQPVVDLQSGAITSFEAAARWTSPHLGEIEPRRFIAIAEDTGSIAQLTDLLLDQACRDAASWPAHVDLSFEVSGALLRDTTFGLKVLAALGRHHLPPIRLELEITENALVRDPEAARVLFGGLRAAGVKIALGDFGTGYSNLYHLRSFKLDKIKIDRSFIGAIGKNPEDDAVVRALIGLGTGLGLSVSAEGVDSAAQTRLLVDQGCRLGQGYFYSTPLEAGQARSLLEAASGEIDRPGARAI